jgi:hypothetical protein
VVILNNSTTTLTTTTCNGRFFDSGGATGTYSVSEIYTHTFAPTTPGSKLKAVFNSFALENNFDFLSIYNGTAVTPANLIGTYTGTQIAAGQAFISTAAGGQLTFRFTSGTIINLDGWDVSLTCVTVPRIDSFTPTSSCFGATPTVIINGANFIPGQTTVSFNGVAATTTSVTATVITVNVPASATTGSISVSTPAATGVSTTIFSINPAPAAPNAGADTIVCAGTPAALNAIASVGNQIIVTNNCSSISGWTTNDSSRWNVATTNNAGGSAGGEFRFFWFASGTVDVLVLIQLPFAALPNAKSSVFNSPTLSVCNPLKFFIVIYF